MNNLFKMYKNRRVFFYKYTEESNTFFNKFEFQQIRIIEARQ